LVEGLERIISTARYGQQEHIALNFRANQKADLWCLHVNLDSNLSSMY
jgi:hypothetical protein